MAPPRNSNINSSNNTAVDDSCRALQDRLHVLLSKLSSTIDHIKNWPEASNASIHVESTSKLIDCIRQVVASLEKVEGVVKTGATLRKSLQDCWIPLDLLDLLDSSNLNPDCFTRGLLREALGQLAGLKRRKLALKMLGNAVQAGMKAQKKAAKRKRRARAAAAAVAESSGDDDNSIAAAYDEQEDDSPPQKKARTSEAEASS